MITFCIAKDLAQDGAKTKRGLPKLGAGAQRLGAVISVA